MILFTVSSYVIEVSWWISNVCLDLRWSIKVVHRDLTLGLSKMNSSNLNLYSSVSKNFIYRVLGKLFHVRSSSLVSWISEPRGPFWRDHIKAHCMEKIITWLRLTNNDYVHSSSKALGMKMKPLPEDQRVTLLLLCGALNWSVELCLNS